MDSKHLYQSSQHHCTQCQNIAHPVKKVDKKKEDGTSRYKLKEKKKKEY